MLLRARVIVHLEFELKELKTKTSGRNINNNMTKHKRHLTCVVAALVVSVSDLSGMTPHTVSQVNASCLAGHEIELEVEFGLELELQSHVSGFVFHCGLADL